MEDQDAKTRAHMNGSNRLWLLAVWPWVRKWYWLLSVGILLLSLLLGFWGFCLALSKGGAPIPYLDAMYNTLRMMSLNVDMPHPVPCPLQWSRFLTPILLTNALLSGLLALFREKFDSFRLRLCRDHVIICGLGKKGLRLAKEYRKAGYAVVVVEKECGNEYVGQFGRGDTVVVFGDATNPAVLQRVGVARAHYLLALSGNDGVNAEIAAQACALVPKGRKPPLRCLAHILDLDLCRLLQERQIGTGNEESFSLEFFNANEMAARILLARHAPPEFKNKNAGVPSHIVVVGLGRVGSSLVVQAAREWRNRKFPERLYITVIDRYVRERYKSLTQKYPQLKTVCEFRQLSFDARSEEFGEAEFLQGKGNRPPASVIYTCMGDDDAGLAAALILHRSDSSTPIIVCMSERGGFAALFQDEETGRAYNSNIRVFRILDEVCLPDALGMSSEETMARALHAEYVANQLAEGKTPETNRSAVPWEQLPDHLKASNLHQARFITKHLESCGYRIVWLTDWDAEDFKFPPDEIEQMAEKEHERWCEERRAAGFTYAPPPRTATTHPDLKPWPELDEHTRDIDRNAIRAIPRILARLGFQVQKVRGL